MLRKALGRVRGRSPRRLRQWAMRWPSAGTALTSAALFGASMPLAKGLGLDRAPLAGTAVLYGGAALGLGLARLAGRRGTEAALVARDVPLLAAIVVLGGLVGPVLQLSGLARTSALAASLLLNLEGVFTVLVAVVVLHEHLGRVGALATGLVIAGGAWLGAGGASDAAPGATSLLGAALVAGACLAWAFDNALMRSLAARDPRAVAACKGVGAATCAALLAWWGDEAWPDPGRLALGLLVGAVCYGGSLALYLRAQRDLGAARTGALFSTAPFVGAVLSVAILGEPLTLSALGACVLMAAGVLLLARSQHDHEHVHVALEHDHRHVHDEHHRHAHTGDEPPEPHAHRHRHEPLRHAHPHLPDLHHRHRH